MGFLALAELGLLAAEPAFGLGDLHAFAGAGADEVGFEFGDHGQDVEHEPADGVGRVVDGAADAQLYFAFGEVFDDVPRVGERAGEPVQLGDDKGVAVPNGGEGLAQSRPFSGPAGQSVIDIDPAFGNPEGASPFRWAVRSCSLVETRAYQMMCAVMGATVAVEPPRRAFLRAGCARIWDRSICMEFFAAGERPEVVAVGDRLTGEITRRCRLLRHLGD